MSWIKSTVTQAEIDRMIEIIHNDPKCKEIESPSPAYSWTRLLVDKDNWYEYDFYCPVCIIVFQSKQYQRERNGDGPWYEWKENEKGA